MALVAGSVSMAVARGQALAMSRGGTTIVICTGYGVMTIALDERGNPVGPVHLCPDCLAGMTTYLPASPVVIVPIVLASERVVLPAQVAQPRPASVLVTRARGPPLRV